MAQTTVAYDVFVRGSPTSLISLAEFIHWLPGFIFIDQLLIEEVFCTRNAAISLGTMIKARFRFHAQSVVLFGGSTVQDHPIRIVQTIWIGIT